MHWIRKKTKNGFGQCSTTLTKFYIDEVDDILYWWRGRYSALMKMTIVCIDEVIDEVDNIFALNWRILDNSIWSRYKDICIEWEKKQKLVLVNPSFCIPSSVSHANNSLFLEELLLRQIYLFPSFKRYCWNPILHFAYQVLCLMPIHCSKIFALN